MKNKIYIQNQSDEMILFFGGWGIDFRPLEKYFYNSQKNITFIYDYTSINLSDELKDILKNYKITLIAWSMGVLVANSILQDYKLEKAIAVNGTLEPVSDKYGIYEKIFDLTIRSFNNDTAINFAKKMCLSNYEQYMKNFPKRTNLKEELVVLREFAKKNKMKNIFTTAIISENDKIIPPKHQIEFWKSQNVNMIKLKKTSHFCFYNQDILSIISL